MSRLGKLPVAFPSSVTVTLTESNVIVKGAKGELSTLITGDVDVTVDNGQIWVKPANDSKRSRAMWGTVRSNVKNLVQGVTEGFVKRLEINGVGYRAAVQGNVLTLLLGFSHEIKYIVPTGITVVCEKPTLIVISGADKQKVGQVSAEIRSLRKPEPYKGKGVRYEGEFVPMKEGKKK
jgi:large subunit ribosomal protein L6